MGIEATTEEKNKNEIVSISSDQLYVSDKKEENKKKDEPAEVNEQTTESAAITMAKKAAQNAMNGKEIKRDANLELEASADLENSTNIS